MLCALFAFELTEEQLENLCLDWFREGGWDVLHGPDIAPDGSNPLRSDYAQTILENDLRQVFEKINPHLPAQVLENCFEQVLSKISKPESLDLVTNNRAFHRLLLEGVAVEFKLDDYIDYDLQFEKTFLAPLQAITQLIGWKTENAFTLEDLF